MSVQTFKQKLSQLFSDLLHFHFFFLSFLTSPTDLPLLRCLVNVHCYAVFKKRERRIFFPCMHVINLSSHHLTPTSFWKWAPLTLFFARYTFYSSLLFPFFPGMLMYEANYRWIKRWINPCNFLHSDNSNTMLSCD